MLINWGFKISTFDFDGPFLNFSKGNELSPFGGIDTGEKTLFCMLDTQ